MEKEIDWDSLKDKNLDKKLTTWYVCEECGDTGRGKPTLQEPDGVDCNKCNKNY